MTNAWLGVVSLDHVQAAVKGEFCQLNHGKLEPLQRIHPGDHIVYYAPREQMHGGNAVQAFVALGLVLPSEPYQLCTMAAFKPFRRAVSYYHGNHALIRPLLPSLSFTRGQHSWGQALRRGTLKMEPADLVTIANAMGIILN